jgi:purine-cytosine permease-like protein
MSEPGRLAPDTNTSLPSSHLNLAMSDEQQPANDGGEFEREPVPRSRLLGFGSFIGMYAGEHCAGTELMIGPLFVAAGVSAFDLIVGLLLGNALAVLSWMLMTAPIATRARLTLYYQLEKITGRKLVTAYSLANGAMFCILAGSMITVSATALGVWFKFDMPALNDALPNGVGWVIAVLATGVAFTVVAAFGYEALARFANLAAPWMVAIFLAFALVGLRNFVVATGAEIHSATDLWDLCKTTIWKGGEPLPGRPKFHLAHVTFFAWFCNMAMHIGMSDLSVFRFARKSWYGVATASGMYLGHFLAWIAAALLFAYQLHETHPDDHLIDLLTTRGGGQYSASELREAPLTPELIRRGMEIESQLVEEGVITEEQKKVSPPTPLPGPLAAQACGIAGLICVVVAGWTTANPTIYRSGLAFQAMFPKTSRVTMTMVTGLLATIAGMFPLVAMKLLDFVALYGLLLMPMGAVVFVDFWLMRKFGLQDRFAERAGLSFNWAAGVAWIATLIVCGYLAYTGRVEVYFVSLPGWFLAAALYVVLSVFLQRSAAAPALSKEWT